MRVYLLETFVVSEVYNYLVTVLNSYELCYDNLEYYDTDSLGWLKL